MLNWHLRRGIIPLPKTARVGRLSENINVSDFDLTEEEMAKIEALDNGTRVINPIIWPGL